MLIRAIVALALLIALPAQAQEAQSQELERQIEEMKERFETRISDLEDQLDELQSRADPAQPRWAQALNAFNPAITVFGNFVGRLDDKRVENENGDAIDDRFNLREVELDFRAAVDPWANAVVIFTAESEVPGEFETVIEEGYVVLKQLPVIDAAPLGLRLKAGRFRPRFGRENVIHTHDLPQTARPRSLQTFLGEEGYIENGVSAEFLVPTPGQKNTLTGNVDVLNGGTIRVGEDNGGEDPAVLAHLGWFWEPADGHEVDLGVSAWQGRFDEAGSFNSHLYGADFLYSWKPYVAGESRSFLLGGEVFYADIERAGGMTHATPVGAYAWSQLQLSRNLYLNGRFDYTEDLFDNSLETRTASGALSYYTTEFLRFRLGYERSFSDVRDIDHLDTFFFEINFVFGSHPAEPYWVNR